MNFVLEAEFLIRETAPKERSGELWEDISVFSERVDDFDVSGAVLFVFSVKESLQNLCDFIYFYSLLLSGVMKPRSDVQYTHTQFTDNNTLQPGIVQFQQAPVRKLQPCRRMANSHSIALLSRISLYVRGAPLAECQVRTLSVRQKITFCFKLEACFYSRRVQQKFYFVAHLVKFICHFKMYFRITF